MVGCRLGIASGFHEDIVVCRLELTTPGKRLNPHFERIAGFFIPAIPITII